MTDKEWVEWIEKQDKRVPGYRTPEYADDDEDRAVMRIPWKAWKEKRKQILG